VLEQREIKRVGGDRTHKVDVRVLAATNRDLREEVNKGTFREDLYFRLSVVHVELPPMRERRDDIPGLANHFLREVGARRGMTMSWSQDAMAALISHSWPGNVREMRNVVERAAALSDGPVLTRGRSRVRPRDGAERSRRPRLGAGRGAGRAARGRSDGRCRAAAGLRASDVRIRPCSRLGSASRAPSRPWSTRSRPRTSRR